MPEADYPDIEIYLKRVETARIIEWLKTLFDEVKDKRAELAADTQVRANNATTYELTTGEGERFECVVNHKAVKGGFVSVWFKSNQTPWATDRECAAVAYEYFQVEVRCSTGGWKGEDEAGWLRFTDKGEQVVNWLQP